jgi:O-6-methylguanine DNA methyltransferase
MAKIPYGKTRSYKEIAELVKKPKAARAVAATCARNHLLIIIPCHRVIASNGDLRGFAAGLDRKEWLLTHEGYAVK